MKKTKYLTLEQNSAAERTARGLKWDTERGDFKRCPLGFEEVCELFPHLVSEVGGVVPFPRWGHAHYIKGDDGMLKLLSENWDTGG